jgi:putative phage-type endonuclease
MLNKEQWLADRKKGIGGSEVSAILGLNKYKSAFQVWHDKTGRSSEQTENNFMKFGAKAEKLVVEYWEEKSGIKTKECGHLSHPTYNFILGTPDRLYEKNGIKGVLECKTSKMIITPEDPRFMNFFCQLQWYMGLAEAKIGEVAILGRLNCDFDGFEFDFNPDFYDEILEKIVYFWEKNVLKDIPPDPVNAQDVEKLFRKHINGKFVEANDFTLGIVNKLKDIKKCIKNLEDEEEKLCEQLKLLIRDNEGITYNEKSLVTWKTANDSVRFDFDSFKIAYPGLYKKFQKDVSGSRRFLVK